MIGSTLLPADVDVIYAQAVKHEQMRHDMSKVSIILLSAAVIAQ